MYTWYGVKTTHVETATIVKGTLVHSGTGQNILRTEHGGLESIATQFSSLGGTQIYAHDDVLLYSLNHKSRVQFCKQMVGIIEALTFRNTSKYNAHFIYG